MASESNFFFIFCVDNRHQYITNFKNIIASYSGVYILPSNLISFPLPHVFQREIFHKRIFYFWLGAEACSEDFRRDGKVKIFIIVTQATRLVGISEGMCPSLEGIIPFLKIQILTSTSIWIFRKVMIRSIWSIKDAVYTLTI